MNNREEAYITFCKSHDGNWSARDLFNGGYQAGLASQPAQLSSNPLQLPAQAQQDDYASHDTAAHHKWLKQVEAENVGKVNDLVCDLSQAQQTESKPEPYAYDVPTEDGTELAYAIYYTKYNNPFPEGAIPLYASQQEPVSPNISVLKRIAKELKTYIPEADEYKGKFIHKVWAKEIESALPPAPEGGDK